MILTNLLVNIIGFELSQILVFSNVSTTDFLDNKGEN